MNTNEILAKAEEIKGIQNEINLYERFISLMSDGGLYINEHSGKKCISDLEDVRDLIYEAFNWKRKILKNELHKMNNEPLEEIQEQKTSFEEIDNLFCSINEDEYKNREDKEELLRDYLEDYKKIRKLIENYYDDIEMLRYEGNDTKDATYNYHRNIKSLFEDIKSVYEKRYDLLAFYDNLHDEIKSTIRDIDKRLTDTDEEVDKITGYVDNSR